MYIIQSGFHRFMPLLHEGQLIRETYEVERFLGQGAFAEVYRVKHPFLGRQAMRVFKRVGMGLDEIHEMLAQAILLWRMGQPNIVRDVGLTFPANEAITQDFAEKALKARQAGRLAKAAQVTGCFWQGCPATAMD